MTSPVTASVSKKLSLFSFVAAVLVLLIHTPKTPMVGINHFIECGVCEIAVPFFFVVSGFMIARHIGEDGWWKREAGKRLKSLLVPYLFWCLVATLVYAGTYVAVNIFKDAPLTRNLEVFSLPRIFGFDLTEGPIAGPLWYVRELLLLLLPLPLISKIVLHRNRYAGFTFILSCLALQVFVAYYVDAHPSSKHLYAYCLSPRAVLFYAAGVWLCRHPIHLRREVGIVCFIAGLGLMAFRTLTLDAAISQHIGYSTLLWMVSVIILLTGAWSITPAYSLPKIFVGVAFPMYLMHDIIIHPLGVLLEKVGLWPGYDRCLVGVMSVWIGVAVVCVLATLALRKFLPRFAKIAFGGR